MALPVLPHNITPNHIAKSIKDVDEDLGRYTLTDFAWRWYDGWGLSAIDTILRRIEIAILDTLKMSHSRMDERHDIVERIGSMLSTTELCGIWHGAIAASPVAQEAQE